MKTKSNPTKDTEKLWDGSSEKKTKSLFENYKADPKRNNNTGTNYPDEHDDIPIITNRSITQLLQ